MQVLLVLCLVSPVPYPISLELQRKRKMKIIYKVMLTSAALTLSADFSSADESSVIEARLKETLTKCQAEVASAQLDEIWRYEAKIYSLLSEVRKLPDVSDEILSLLSNQGAACLSAKPGNAERVFVIDAMQFKSRMQVEAAIRLEEQAIEAEIDAAKKIIEAEKAALEAAALLKQEEAMQAEISLRVYAACTELAQENNVAAFTNSLCVSSFRANGLPQELAK